MQAFRTDREFAYVGRKWNETSGPSYDIDVLVGSKAVLTASKRDFRGRDASYLAPPAQIRTGPIRAYGSHLGCLTAKRLSGHG
ncbi:hypothetical protein SAMN05444171_1468 [Bradyrhizobium lablabi]|uniref:Uncharacterized protein n=2 Tax=Bradyrhizobium TaxID=374 RepID=A0ABY0Q579_9BRAD|nr:hypothetical protein SAMN05444163_5690 [Bradyrhizobium ottawaense]SEC46179.1 hypothetical protein SAMN05444171_1468 [Bradyrhizobium lablabi]